MCGIAGLFDIYGKVNYKKNIVTKALKFIEYRGPDELNTQEPDNNFCGGAVRLSIEALTNGRQPITEKQYTVGFNGEIFNYKELARLYGLIDPIKSEVHFLLKAWQKKGKAILKDLDGQFTIFIYDSKKKEIILARDPFGIRPLFFIHDKKFLAFCSEIKGLAKLTHCQLNFDEIAVAQVSMFWSTVGERTIFENVKQVKRGQLIVFNSEGMRNENYYTEPLLLNSPIKFKSIDEASIFIRSNLEKSIKTQSHGEVGFCSYLSGGIDSSALAYFISKQMKYEKLRTFSITFEDEQYDESDAQKQIASYLGTDHTSINISHADIASNFSSVINHSETLLFRTAPVPMYLLSKAVKDTGHKVVFTGEGADEVLLGYDLFAESRIRKFWSKFPNSKIRPKLLSKLYSYLPQFKNSRYFAMIKDFYSKHLCESDQIFYSHLVRWVQFKYIASFFNFSLPSIEIEEILYKELTGLLPQSFVDISNDKKAQLLEYETLLHGYLLSSQGDRMSMAHSVEGRYPYLGISFVKEMAKIADNQKTSGIKSKSLFRRSMSDILPYDICNRSKVAYQAPEAKSFIRNGYISNEAVFLNDTVKDLSFINKDALNGLIKKITNEFSSERLSFRENMVYVMCMSAAHLDKLSKEWRH